MTIISATGGNEVRSIALETRRGREVANEQGPTLHWGARKQAGDLAKDYPFARCRSGPSGFYNCHGLTFASRRTRIEKPSELAKILHDDEYERIERQDVLPGDVVLYIDSETGDIEHSGVVIEVDPLAFKILSKWGSASEFIHTELDCPYREYSERAFYRVVK